ncbi:MAG: ribbon-helix-helix protein, CopG family [Myxococcales bacterium]|nr:ribbon-helix-helix protein, CopG family [Myxococcales bacterium]
MRTTIDLNDELMRKLKRRAADEGLTLRAVIERALRAHLEQRVPPRKKYRLSWRTEGGGLRPGVSVADFEHGSRLRDLMDGLE